MTYRSSTISRSSFSASFRRAAFVGGRCFLLAALALAIGCERPAPAPVPTATILPKGDTPEAKLDRVLQRLDFALQAAQGSPNFGVKSDRSFQHRLIPPSKDEPRYTAEVDIETRRLVIAKNGPKPPAPAPKDKAKAKAGDESADPARPQSATNIEREKFLLVYDKDRWTLPVEPESETLKICFDSALKEE